MVTLFRRPSFTKSYAASLTNTASCSFMTKCKAAWDELARCLPLSTSAFRPYIVTIAKGIASGMPLAATIARADVMNWPPGAHASTFGGNPVSIAAALTTIELLEESLVQNAARMGAYMLDRISAWPGKYEIVGDVRGRGLMIGIELIRDKASRERATDKRDKLEQLAFERGLLVLGCGPNTIRLCPPLVITQEQADFAMNTLEAVPADAEIAHLT